MIHRDILKPTANKYCFERRLRSRVDFFEADIYDAECLGRWIGTIASPQKIFLRSYSGFRPFFGIHFLARNSKMAHF